ncbi:MAG: hypothetical protein R3E64_11495 [Halioglobus sp.]
MKFSISDKHLDHAEVYFTRPALFYLAASMCWLWLESDDKFSAFDAMWLPGMIALGVYWNFAAPAQGNRRLYQWLTYFIPILIAFLGLIIWYMFLLA